MHVRYCNRIVVTKLNSQHAGYRNQWIYNEKQPEYHKDLNMFLFYTHKILQH